MFSRKQYRSVPYNYGTLQIPTETVYLRTVSEFIHELEVYNYDTYLYTPWNIRKTSGRD